MRLTDGNYLYTFYLIFDATIPDKNRRTLRGNMDDQKSDILCPKSRGGVPWLGHRSLTFFTFVALQ